PRHPETRARARPASGTCSSPAAVVTEQERLAASTASLIIFSGSDRRLPDRGPGSGTLIMKYLIVYYLDGKWFGEEVTWKRSGSGFYREISRIEIPQSRKAIEEFARENRFRIEWRGEFPSESRSA